MRWVRHLIVFVKEVFQKKYEFLFWAVWNGQYIFFCEPLHYILKPVWQIIHLKALNRPPTDYIFYFIE